jgi:hypothetical protein
MAEKPASKEFVQTRKEAKGGTRGLGSLRLNFPNEKKFI